VRVGRHAVRFLVAGAALLLLGFPGGSAHALPVQNGNIFFTSERDGNREIYSMRPDGSDQTDLSHNSATDDWAESQGDGGVHFASNRTGDFDIYSMNSFGSVVVGTPRPGNDIQPALGLCKAWVSDRDGNNEIYSDCVSGASPGNYTANPASDTEPSWFPNGGLGFVFSSDRDGNSEIYEMYWDDSNDLFIRGEPGHLFRVTTNPATDSAPSFSPNSDGRLLFETTRDGNYEVYVMASDGTLTNLTNNAASDRKPAWSPDGSKIVFQSLRDGNFEIYAMNADGTGVTRLTNSSGADVNPVWGATSYFGYPRAKGATPIRVSLVPAYRQCTAPNESHGAPLTFPSCNAHIPDLRQTSSALTIGSPDANGATANSIGSLRLDVMPGAAGPPDDSDVALKLKISDVRCLPPTAAAVCSSANLQDGPDYSGEVQARVGVRLTDHTPSVDPPESTTTEDFSVAATSVCVNTPGPNAPAQTGGICSLATSINAVIPGAVVDGARATWQLDQVQVYDGGPDGDVDTADNSLFESQGVYIP
jgi:hypothetical protein